MFDRHTSHFAETIEHQHPIRFVHLRPSAIAGHPEASLVECALAEVRVGKAPPPKLADLFLVAAPGGSSAPK